MLEEIDGKPIKQNERAFLQNLAQRQSQPPSQAPSQMGSRKGSSKDFNRGRPQQLGVSIPSAQSYDLGPRAGLLLGEPPAGYFEETHQPISLGLNAGNRRPWARNA